MRNFFLALLLLNLLAFAYQSWIIEPDTKVEADYLEQDYPSLLIAATEPAEEQAADLTVPDDPLAAKDSESSEPVYRCLRIGPFPQAADAETVREALQGPDVVARQVSEAGQVWVGHWVQVVGQKGRAEAEATRDALVAAGLRDAYIVPAAEDFRISLGVFRALASARSTVNQATALGFSTRIDERYQPGTTFWLLMRLSSDREIAPGDLRSDSGQILRIENLDCRQAEF